jgi:serine phosphatase RsbU (regulator of sigma subunit)
MFGYSMRHISALLLFIFHTGRGRPAAAVILAGFFILQFHTDQSPLKALRLSLFDAYQTYLPRERESAPATIVNIDEASLKQFGQWPWPRTKLAELIERIAFYQPAAIGLDIIMPEPDRSSPAQIAATLPQINFELRKSLTLLPDNDQILETAIMKSPVVLGAAGFDKETSNTSKTMRSASVIIKGGDPLPYLRHFPAILKSIPGLEAAASGQALLSADLEQGVVRRIPLIASAGNAIVPSLSIELLRVAGGLPAIDVEVGSKGIVSVGIPGIKIPTQANGEAWVNFAPFTTDRYVSAADILAGNVNPEFINRKLVLVGLTGIGLLDYQTTSRGERVPGIEVHAQLLENIFDRSFLQRPLWTRPFEMALLLLSGIFVIFAVPALKPKLSTTIVGSLTLLFLGTGFILYKINGILFDAASLSVEINIIFVGLLGNNFIEADREKRHVQQALFAEREASARVAGELEAAKRIQLGSLPRASTAFPDETRFTLDAMLEPARQVGGDLYDFYMLDRRRLFFIVGDVAGKGLPASLFMVMTKVLARSIIMNEGFDVGITINRMNIELSRENPEMVFVTAFAGILHVETGLLEYCIAGHDAPWRISADGAVRQLHGEGNLPLSVMEDIIYPTERIKLETGDSICVVTDGITEAMDRAGNLYGKRRLIRLLEEKAGGLQPSRLLSLVRDDITFFTDNAEQSDDLTLLVVRWNGPEVAN